MPTLPPPVVCASTWSPALSASSAAASAEAATSATAAVDTNVAMASSVVDTSSAVDAASATALSLVDAHAATVHRGREHDHGLFRRGLPVCSGQQQEAARPDDTVPLREEERRSDAEPNLPSRALTFCLESLIVTAIVVKMRSAVTVGFLPSSSSDAWSREVYLPRRIAFALQIFGICWSGVSQGVFFFELVGQVVDKPCFFSNLLGR